MFDGSSRKQLCVLLMIFIVVVVLIGVLIVSKRESCMRLGLFGMAEPLTARHEWEDIDIQGSFENLSSLGVMRLREWIWMGAFLINETTVDPNFEETLNLVILEVRASNLTIMGMSHDFPSWMTGIYDDFQAVPHRNTTMGSNYTVFLEKYRESWKTLAKTFPNITMWEIGNEFNIDAFLHPQGFNETIPDSPRFSIQEKVNITTDLLYYGSLGVHEGNPDAKTVLGGLTGLTPDPDATGIADFLERLYTNINSGQWPSTDPNDYFQVACWHPYLFDKEPTELNWVDPNQAIYDIIKRYEGECKRVVFSEFGYSDKLVSRESVSSYLLKAFQLAKDNFPWLDTIYWFRLLEPHPNTTSKHNPPGFGIIDLDWTWKPAAYAYQSLTQEAPDCTREIFNILVILVVATKN